MSYNGWENYETWNVALWIENDEGLYNIAYDCRDYKSFVEFMREFDNSAIGFETPDGVSWKDSALDIEALDEMFEEMHG